MKITILGIGDLAATNEPGSILKTFALGSCVAITLLDPGSRTVGMAHVALPESRINPEKAELLPGYFADTAMPALLREMSRCGAPPGGQGMLAKLAGGASIMDQNGTFNIGRRNLDSIRELLLRAGIRTVAEEAGGTISRTVSVAASTGKLTLSSPGRRDWEI